MRILYSAGKRNSSQLQTKRFLENCSHDIVVAGYKSKYFNPNINLRNVKLNDDEYLRKVSDLNPDLIICDIEHKSANVAKKLGKPLWLCSSEHLPLRLKWYDSNDYLVTNYNAFLRRTRNVLYTIGKVEDVFVYSPFGDFDIIYKNNPDQKWITPYHIKLEDKEKYRNIAVITDSNRLGKLVKTIKSLSFNCSIFCNIQDAYSYKNLHSNLEFCDIDDVELYSRYLSETKFLISMGETGYLSDAIYNGVNHICVAPSLSDNETLMNAIYCKYLQLGSDVGQVELMDRYSVDEIESVYYGEFSPAKLSMRNHNYLHEEIDKYDR